jgi:hypothetical protein
MKTITDYQNLKTELETISAIHKKQRGGLESTFISVSASGMNWREAKKIGMKKDYYYGWVFYSDSTNSNGYALYEKIKQACEGFNLYVSERQL